jgi:hypothetical protein
MALCGRIYVWAKGRWVPRARVMYCEAMGIPLATIAGQVVHHLNGKCWDDRIENLKLVDDKKHRSEHFSGANNPRYLGWTKEQVITLGKKHREETDLKKWRWQKIASRGKIPSTRTIQLMFGNWTGFRVAVMEG